MFKQLVRTWLLMQFCQNLTIHTVRQSNHIIGGGRGGIDLSIVKYSKTGLDSEFVIPNYLGFYWFDILPTMKLEITELVWG